jgi:hypothetical protein
MQVDSTKNVKSGRIYEMSNFHVITDLGKNRRKKGL